MSLLYRQNINSRVADKKDRMGMTTVFNAAGVNKDKFVEYTETNPATYKVQDT